MTPRYVMLLGDLHGNAKAHERAFDLARNHRADAIIQCGDYGFWPHTDGGMFLKHASHFATLWGIPEYWLPGNHENWDVLKDVKPNTPEGFTQMEPGIFYLPKGVRWNWCDREIMAVGGAYSIDKEWRIKEDIETHARIDAMVEAEQISYKVLYHYGQDHEHLSWWPDEEITDEDVERILADQTPIDILLTHDKPLASTPDINRKDFIECVPNQRRIQRIVNELHPSLLVHGHLHYKYVDEIRAGDDGQFCRVLGLDAEGKNNRTIAQEHHTPTTLQGAVFMLDLRTMRLDEVNTQWW